MDNVQNYIDDNEKRFVDELLTFLEIPSISPEKEHKKDLQKAAGWIKNQLNEAGVHEVSVIETDGHPLVYAEYRHDPQAPTLLCYGHYDVQPPDPVDLWNSDPFSPTLRDGKIYARGASDDKGQMYCHLKAFETVMQNGGPGCNIKFIIEGEEEIGSPHLSQFVAANKELLQADAVLVSDTAMLAKNKPAITVGLRGIAALQIEVTGPNRDLHSGIYGGAVMNPIVALSKMIASLFDQEERVAVRGFYKAVAPVDHEERARLAEAASDNFTFQKEIGLQDLFGEPGYSAIERTTIRPSLDINGIYGGYTGEGMKTVLPAKATAKITARLVPDQDSATITQLIKEALLQRAPLSVRAEVKEAHGAEPVVVSTKHAAYRAAHQAMASVWGREPLPIRGGGSIPIVAMFDKELKATPILMGFGQDEDAIHSPNESFGLENYLKGIATVAGFMKSYGQEKNAPID